MLNFLGGRKTGGFKGGNQQQSLAPSQNLARASELSIQCTINAILDYEYLPVLYVYFCVRFCIKGAGRSALQSHDQKKRGHWGRVESVEPTVHIDDQQFLLHIQDGGRRRVSNKV